MRSLLPLLIGATLITTALGLTVTVSSSSAVVGALANYSVTLSAATAIKQVDFTFSSWTDTNTDPFTSNTQVLFAGLTLTPVYFPQKLICILSSTSTGSTFTITNVYNPSSTKPTPITVTLYPSSGASSSYSASLTMTQISNTSFSLSKYSSVLGATSSSVEFYLSPQISLQLSSSTLKITYNPSLITITVGTSTQYSIVSQTAGSIELGSFSTSSNLLKIGNTTIANPQAAVTYTIDCLFRITSGGNVYEIERFSNTVTLQTVAFSAISTSTTLYHGVQSSVTIASTCPYTSISNGTTVATSFLSYDSTQLTFSSTSTCQSISSSSCQFTRTGSDTLTLITPSLLSFSTASVTLTSRTYLNGQLYSLCQSTLNISVSPQSFTTTTNTSLCSSSVVNGQNTINIAFAAQGVAAGDRVYIKGITGTVKDSSWSSQSISGTTWYYYTLLAANLSTSGNTTSGVVALTYLNPTYTSSPSLTSVALSRSSFMYATATGPSLCPVTTPLSVSTSSLSQATSSTYSPNTITLQCTFQLFDYKAGDHLLLSFTSSTKAKQYLLLGSYINISYGVVINGLSASSTKNNDTSLWVQLGTGMLPSESNPVVTIAISNIVNPPFVSSIGIDASTHEKNSNGTKEILNKTGLAYVARALTYTADQLLLLRNNSLTITLSNPYRNTLNINSSAYSTLTITLPSTISCPSLPNSTLTLNWLTSVTTSGTLYSGNTTHLTFSPGQCYVNYFTGNTLATVTQTFNGSQSSSTSPALSNLCGDDCYSCSGSTCTACFNSTYSTATLLFSGKCYSSCPAGSYQTSTTSCAACHTSCATCSGPAYTQCNSCASNYIISSGVCISVCGIGKYLSNNICYSCHINCQACTSATSCYLCNTNATMISSVCYFTSCLGNCLTCEGTQSTCTSCSSGFSLYKQQCLSSCPSGTYQTSSATCQQITQSNAYIPVTLTGLLCVLALLALRAYSSKKIGSDVKRSKDYRQDSSTLYKINLWRVAAVIYTFLEIIAAIVLAYKNGSYNVSSSASPAALVGLFFHLILNVVFIVGYCVISRKARVANEESSSDQPIKLRQKVVLLLSLISFRSYRLLQANLFLDRSPPSQEEQSVNPMASVGRKEQTVAKPSPKQKEPLREINKENIDRSNLKRKESQLKNVEPKGESNSITPSKKAIRVNGLGDQIQNEVPIQRTNSIVAKEDEGIVQKRVNYPLLCYLSLASLITATLVLLIAACLQIVSSTFSNTLFTGIDAVIVTIVSLLLSSWDLWNSQNLTAQQLNSEVSSQEVNNTHENLKQAAEMEVQVEISPKEGKRTIRPTRSNRSWGQESKDQKSKSKRSEQEEVDEKPPLLKVFEDLEDSEKTVEKETKTKKFSTKNLRYGKKGQKNNISVSNTRKQLQGQLWDDLYINFQSNRPERDASTTYNYQKSQRSVSPNHSLGEKELDLEGNFQEQPPIFPDISDIQDVRVEEVRQMSPQSDEIDPQGL